jgi:uncharacterized repeat protein (TIGR03803 family)
MFRGTNKANNGSGHRGSFPTPTRMARRIRQRSLVASLVFLLASSARAQIGFEPVRSFGFPEGMGDSPSGGIIEGSDHMLYGTTVEGGASGNYGVVYRLQRDGSGYTVLHHFLGAPSDGAKSVAALVEDADGILYGTTSGGGTNDGGAVFRLNKDGSGYGVLHHFGTGVNDGQNLQAGILIGSDGMLYGATRMGGSAAAGTLFKLNRDGSGYSVFYHFQAAADGAQPRGTLLEVSNRIYGTTSAAGAGGRGTVFAVNKDGADFAVLHPFTGSPEDGFDAWDGLLRGTDGAIYGTTRQGGSADKGTIFKVNTDGSGYEVLHHFGGPNDGQEPWASLVEGADAKLYGTARNGGLHINGIVFRLNKNGDAYETLHHFDGGIDEGYRPEGTLIRASDGALYGTTRNGGRGNIGSVYKLQQDGSGFATLRSFSVCGGDGSETSSRLLAATDGYLYGTTFRGGAYEFGAIFKVRNDGADYRLLHSFDFDTSDGVNPYEGLIEGSDGMLYGATRFGGGVDAGTVYKLNTDGSSYNVIHRFTGTNGTGRLPTAGVIEGSDGKLYGRTLEGGSSGGATIFRLNRDGTGFMILRDSPVSGGNRYYAYSGLIEGRDGRLYGNSSWDGDHAAGTVFGLNKDGTRYEVLHHFNTIGGDGNYPEGGVIEASDGKLYGTTSSGGAFDSGVLFRIDKDGASYSILHQFNSATNGAYYPVGDLHEAPGGTLLGVTYFGGPDDGGTIYMINRDGGGFAILHSFLDSQRAGQNPNATLIRGADGGLYGTAVFGGAYGCGSIFRVAPITVTIAKESSGYRVRLAGRVGQRYTIERTAALPSGWMDIGSVDNSTGTADFLDTSGDSGQTLYRCRLTLP